MVADFAKKSLLEKARNRPDLVRQVIDKARREGVLSTFESVRNRLDQPMALGYSSSGTVLAVGDDVLDFQVGDLVACAGGGYAAHAETVCVPKNLAAKLPLHVELESAAFATVGAIALQGIRLAEVKLGERVAVIGLGLLGQLTVQMLRAAGCRVVGMDIRDERAELALRLGAESVATSAQEFAALCAQVSSGDGVDAVLITADTKENQPVELAGDVARDKGIVVAVGAIGMSIPRKVYYEKELDFRISRSYGPGRYDPEYEEKGHDYPIGYVRWTENRNMQAFMQLVAEGKVVLAPLITHRFPIADAAKAYELITGKTGEPFLGVLIIYPDQPDVRQKIELQRTGEASSVTPHDVRPAERGVAIGLLGAGNFATATLLPAMKRVDGVSFIGVCAATGLSARAVGDKFSFRFCTTDENEIFHNAEITTVVIATRHHLHARQVIAALNAGKHVFVEKPLCLNESELSAILQTYASHLTSHVSRPVLMVGYNRRFAPMARQLKTFLSEVYEPLIMHYRVNAGYIPPTHWVHDPAQGGGRVLGEVCHFVDFLTFLAGVPPVQVQAHALPNTGHYSDDNVVVTIEFVNGSLGEIVYVANGDKAFAKERLEVFGGGSVAVLDDFRRLELVRDGRKQVSRSWLRQDKGHRDEWKAFTEAVRNGAPLPISFEDIVHSTLTTFAIAESLRTNMPIVVDKSGVEASALSKVDRTGAFQSNVSTPMMGSASSALISS
jgi:predicted dehydrogenase